MYGFGGYYGSSWLIFVLPAMLFAAYAQMKIKSSFNKYSKVPNAYGYTGAQVARMILDKNGLNNIRVESVGGTLSDHYDPRNGIIRLSNHVYSGSSIASMSVAAHEVGHAIQHSEGYFPLILRNNIAPVAGFGSRLVGIFVLLGLIMSLPMFIDIGVFLFLAVVAFQLITLPVEFNASRRALIQLEEGISTKENLLPAKKVLNAAALTYVAATLVAVGQLLRLLSMTNRRRN